MSIRDLLRTSEFWVGLVAAVLQFLVAQGVVPKTVSDFVEMGVAYILARVFGKVARATIKAGSL